MKNFTMFILAAFAVLAVTVKSAPTAAQSPSANIVSAAECVAGGGA